VAVVLWVMKNGNLQLAEAPQESVVHKPLPQQNVLPEPSLEIPLEKSAGFGEQALAIPDQNEYEPAPDTVINQPRQLTNR